MIALRLHPGPPPAELVLYRIAGHDLALDLPLPSLAPFRAGTAPTPASPPALPGRLGHPVFQGDANLGGRLRRVEALLDGETYRVTIEGAGTFAVATQGAVHLGGGSPSPELLEEVVLGPVLMLVLALRGTFALHAGAVRTPGGAVAFLGESGAGKSTLAALLDGWWSRLADDVLPVGLRHGRPVALPRFPQLKLGPESQPGPAHPEEIPLRAAYLLSPPAGHAQVQPLSVRDSVLALVRHTVAARLFGPDLLAAHLGFCGLAGLRVATLAYPRHRSAARGIRDVIAADLAEPGL